MGVVVSKRPYSSIPTDTSDHFSSINMTDYPSNNGMSVVYEKGVHRQHFRRVLAPTATRGVAFRGDAKEVSTSARRLA